MNYDDFSIVGCVTDGTWHITVDGKDVSGPIPYNADPDFLTKSKTHRHNNQDACD
jgi:hypothetical protein